MKEGSTLSRALCVTRNSQGYNCIADIDTLGCECDLQGTRDHHTGVFDVRSSSAWLTAALQVAECTGTTGLQIMEQRWAPGKTAGVRHKHGTHGTKFSKLKKPHSLMFHTAFWTALSVSHVNLGTPVETEINGPGREASSLQVFRCSERVLCILLVSSDATGPGLSGRAAARMQRVGRIVKRRLGSGVVRSWQPQNSVLKILQYCSCFSDTMANLRCLAAVHIRPGPVPISLLCLL